MKRFLLATLFIAFVCSADARIRLPWFISDGMVLQQDTDAALWGWARAGAMVKVSTSWNKAVYSIKADENGKDVYKRQRPWIGYFPDQLPGYAR